ncbi:ORF1B [Veiled chameleon serpentovirus B]|nr:ORF1B [Veiled chameleon serpentovirus B]QRC47041.1 ORF1B [Veiled chameleon serpentovirus B]
MVHLILQDPKIPYVEHLPSTIDSEGETHWVFVNSFDCGIKKLQKMNTVRILINNVPWLLKVIPKDDLAQEMACYDLYKNEIDMPVHKVVYTSNGVGLLLRGPVTSQSLGDLVYSHFANNDKTAPPIPDKGDKEQAQRVRLELANKLRPAFPGLNKLRKWCLKCDPRLPITLDNIDLCGRYMDFGDINTGSHNIDIALSDFMRLWSLTEEVPPDYTKEWFPVNHNFVDLSWFEKVAAINNNLLHAPTVATELFVDTDTGLTSQYFNNITGHYTIDTQALDDVSPFCKNLFYLQDPGLRWRKPVLNVSERIECMSATAAQRGGSCVSNVHAVYYNEEAHDFFQKHLGDGFMNEIFGYTYFQGDQGDTLADLMLYDYQGKLFLQPHTLKFLYYRTLKDFGCCATDKRYTNLDCTPRNSSLGPSHPTLVSIKQKKIYEAAPDNFIEELVDLSAKSPLIFTTKVIQKFALTAKPRARTVAACSMFSSSLFRALHKPVTANFVIQAQNPLSNIHHCIGVTKFHHGFHNYFVSRHGNIDDWHIFGSDYTKCDRSFPLVLRAAAAALLFELGGWEPNNYHFTNEVHAFMLDIVECNEGLFNKPGGTSSGDATTAFANTLYNHMVHLLVQLQTIISSPIDKKHYPLEVAAVQGWSTGDFSSYDSLLDIYNSKSYKFNFLSDDSFILTSKDDPTLPKIYNKVNFSRKLETIIHTTVDEDKAWEADGHLHEFCSSEVRLVNGILQYIPSKARMIATLVINSQLYPLDMEIVRCAAILAECAIYSSVDPMFWSVLVAYLHHLIDKSINLYSTSFLPAVMEDEKFYKALIAPKTSDGESAEDILNVFFEDKEMRDGYFQQSSKETVSAYKQCYTCQNPTISVCEHCPVPYPLCAFCAYDHFMDCGHGTTHLPKCQFAGCTEFPEPNTMFYCMVGCGFETRCIHHKTEFSIPFIDDLNKSFKIPLSQQCVRLPSNVGAISKNITNFADETLFQWDFSRSESYNLTKLLHESNLLDRFNEENEEILTYSIQSAEANTICIEGCRYGPTTYAYILDDNGKQKQTCTLDPIGGNCYTVSTVDGSKIFTKYSHIVRTSHAPNVIYPREFDRLRNAEFILGPPGTGKTTFFINNHFSRANEFNKVVYTAPTHRLIQDMDDALESNSDVTVMKSKLNNREYKHPTNDPSKSIHLATTNVVRPTKGCVLLIDECSLLTPKTLLEAVMKTQPSKIVIVGDPFQLAPVTPLKQFSWQYDSFYLRQIINAQNQSVLKTCYRCPSEIFNTFAGAYVRKGIEISAHKAGGFVEKVTIPSRGVTVNSEVEKFLQDAFSKVGPDGIIITNYRDVVIGGSRIGINNIITIDSAQGITQKNVAVFILGQTGFTKVVNRLIVALSRATTSLYIYANQEMHEYMASNLAIAPANYVIPQADLTRKSHLSEVSIYEVADYIDASGVCDIEFYHVKHAGLPNFLGCGEINILTSRQATFYLRPFYNRDGVYECPTDQQICVSKPWRYMMRFLPNQNQSKVYLNTLCHFVRETTDLERHGFIFVLFNGRSDIGALADMTFPAACCQKCDKPARFESDRGPFCQIHAKSETLIGFAGASVFNITSRVNLSSKHNEICGKFHGEAHSANVDVTMTACLLKHQIGSMLHNMSVPRVYKKLQDKEFVFQKVGFSLNDKNNRLYGDAIFVKTETGLGVLSKHRDPQLMPPPCNTNHSSDYEPKYLHKLDIQYSCHPVSDHYICTNCITFYKSFMQLQRSMRELGYEYEPEVWLHLTPREKQLKLSAEVFNTPTGWKVRLGGDSGRYYDFFQSLDLTIRRANFESDLPLPIKEVLIGLHITCSVGVSHNYLPCKLETELESWDTPITTKLIPNFNGVQYVVSRGVGSSTASFTVGLSEHVFTNKDQVARYKLSKFSNGQPVDMEETLFSTGRLYNRAKWLFGDEWDVENVHIELGEYSLDSTKIGGMHMFPKAFMKDDIQYDLHKVGQTPIYHATVIAEGGVKTYDSLIDVHSTLFINKIKQMIDNNTISKKSTILIDYQPIPVMIWASNGELKTAYLQSHAHGPDDAFISKSARTSSTFTGYRIHHPSLAPSKLINDQLVPIKLDDEMRCVYMKDDIVKQPKNISKYVNICNFINDCIYLPSSASCFHVGASSSASYDYIPVGAVVLEQFFTGRVTHFDIQQINNCNGYFKVAPNMGGFPPNDRKYDIIISDVYYNPDPNGPAQDNTQLLLWYINNILNMGGSIIWKTTRYSTITSIQHIARSFGKLVFFTTTSNSSSSEMFVAFIHKCNNNLIQQKLTPDPMPILAHMFANRLVHPVVEREYSLNLDCKLKPRPCLRVPTYMMDRVSEENWKRGGFIEQ